MKTKKYVIDSNFIKTSIKLKLTLTEFLLLTYFDNSDDLIFDIEKVSNSLNLDKGELLTSFNNLFSKKIITLENIKDINGKMYNKVCLDNFYKTLTEEDNNKRHVTSDLFSAFESAFGRPLSSMEYEVIRAWSEKMYSEELIKLALKEAVYNKVTNVKYIDTILYEWNKKGIKKEEDLEGFYKENYDNEKIDETGIFDYNWLDDNDR